MSENERTRAAISALIEDIAQIQRDMGAQFVRDPNDREAFDIIARIERQLRSRAERVAPRDAAE